ENVGCVRRIGDAGDDLLALFHLEHAVEGPPQVVGGVGNVHRRLNVLPVGHVSELLRRGDDLRE
ncbi:MAG TPA: hypothetical protein VIH63_09850, partial [Xanthobacteraceae bacterium]